MLIDRDHIALTAMYISLAALITSLINAAVSWTLTRLNNPLLNDNRRATEAAHADSVGVRLCCANSVWLILTDNGNHRPIPPRWHVPPEELHERIESFLMGLSVSSWDRPYSAKAHDASSTFNTYRWDGQPDEKDWKIAMSYVQQIREEVLKERQQLPPRSLKAFNEGFNRTSVNHWALPVERERRERAANEPAERK